MHNPQATNPLKIPPKAHLIWAGGKKLLAPEGVDIIDRWVKNNKDTQGFTANLWVDKETGNVSMIDEYKQLFKGKGITVLDENEIKEHKIDITTIKPPPVIIRDIKQNNLRNEHVTYEIEKLRPNYGSSSDLLRYEILLKEGGFYCDCTDVEVGKDGLNKIFSREFKRHVLFVEHRPQNPNANDLHQFDVSRIGNDTFAATAPPPLNPVLLQISMNARKKYTLPNALNIEHVRAAHSGNNIKHTTIDRTGPGLVRDVLLNPNNMECKLEGNILVDKNKVVEIHRVRDGSLSLVSPKANTCNWLNTRITLYIDKPEQAIECVIKTIKFEAKYFKVLRLDDHLDDIIIATGGKVSRTEALAKLHAAIQEIKKDIQYTQITGQDKDTIAYTLEHKLVNIFDLDQNLCKEAINAQAYLNDFMLGEKYAELNRQLIRTRVLKNSPMTEECWAVTNQSRPEVIINLCQQMRMGIEFIDNLIKNIGHFKEKLVGEEVRQYFIERLKKFKEYAPILNEKVSREHAINIDKIDSLLVSLSQNKDFQASSTLKPPSK